jgi:hypothetical protein
MPTSLFDPGSFKVAGKVQLVDLSEKAASANIVREGLTMPSVTLDRDALDRFVLEDIVRPSSAPRVVSQSVQAGTAVPRGTVVDLFLAPRQSIPGTLIPAPHRDIAAGTIDGIVTGVLSERVMRERVAKYETLEQMPEAERAAFRNDLERQNVPLDDGQPDRSADAAFRTMKAALAFS